MMGVFVQVNGESLMRSARPVGYVVQESGCWEWVGAKSADGYGRFRDPTSGRMVNAHRFMYEERFGPLPQGVVCDHVACANRGCVNPDHQTPTTNRANVLRGVGHSAQNARKTHCIHGHALEGDNLIRQPGGKRKCKECHRQRQQEHVARKTAHPEEAK